jgi:hypothetical protein
VTSQGPLANITYGLSKSKNYLWNFLLFGQIIKNMLRATNSLFHLKHSFCSPPPPLPALYRPLESAASGLRAPQCTVWLRFEEKQGNTLEKLQVSGYRGRDYILVRYSVWSDRICKHLGGFIL